MKNNLHLREIRVKETCLDRDTKARLCVKGVKVNKDDSKRKKGVKILTLTDTMYLHPKGKTKQGIEYWIRDEKRKYEVYGIIINPNAKDGGILYFNPCKKR